MFTPSFAVLLASGLLVSFSGLGFVSFTTRIDLFNLLVFGSRLSSWNSTYSLRRLLRCLLGITFSRTLFDLRRGRQWRGIRISFYFWREAVCG